MKTTVSLKNNERANVLIVSIMITAIAGMTLGAYLTLTAGENKAVSRSQSWNASIPIVEAGIEEAMTHLNDNCTFTDISHPSTNWGADGWNATDIGYRKSTTLPDGSGYTVDIVTIAPYSQFNPGIVSEGHVASTFASTLWTPNPIFATIGDITTQTTTTSLNTNGARKVEVQCGATALFAKGLVAKNWVDMHGNPVQTDSFDSSDPAYSTGGLYDPTKHKDNGDVATTSGLVDSINAGNATIDGHLSTAPGGSASIGPNGSVGDLAWTSSNTGIEPGHFSDDLNVYFPDVKPPFGGGFLTPTGGTVTNDSRTVGTTTNTVTTWPAGQDPIITNTATVTTQNYPAAGTFLGTPTMNTTHTTTVAYPADGTYTGTVVTNTANVTSTTFPAAGTYIGTPTTNSTSTTTSTFPDDGTYVGLVRTNVTGTNSPLFPADGTYVGTIATNTVPTNSMTYPATGSYVGNVTTNIVTTNSTTLPSTIAGTITTNTSLVTSTSYPADGTYVPPVSTNTTPTTSSTAPADGTYLGTVTTNVSSVTSSTYPSAGTYVGNVTTNTSSASGPAYPPAGSYVGSVTTNTTATTSSSMPASGTYIGGITTNTAVVTTTYFPSAGTYVGSIQTNSQTTTSTSFPSAGTYVGTVTTNCGTTVMSAKTAPAPGTYCGTPWQTGNSDNNSSAWNWYPVLSYTYNRVTSYTYTQVNGYNYNAISGYTYNKINDYTYTKVAGYSYNAITGYTYAQINTYSYVAGTNYSYLGINGYTYNMVSGYTYNQITGYSYQQVSSFTYDLITGWTWAQIVSYTYFTYSSTTGLSVNSYDYILGTGNYELGTLSGNVLVTGNAVLYVTDSINTQSITINPGASLKLYTTAPDVTIAGNGVWNNGGNSTNFMYYGLPENQNLKISGNGSFTGVIYAPEAALDLKGGGNDTIDFIGASVTKTAVLDGKFHFHYDEALRKSGPSSAYAIQSWNEIPLTQRY